MSEILVLVEHDGSAPKRSSLGSISLARQLPGAHAILIIGANVSAVAESLRFFGASSILVVDHPSLAEPLADRYAEVVAQVARLQGAKFVIGTASTFSKDILPRSAALLDAAMLSEVTAVQAEGSDLKFTRQTNAGSAQATTRLEGEVRVLTARGTAFPAPTAGADCCPVKPVAIDTSKLPTATRFISRQQITSTRPDLGEARIVVCGGRPLKDPETFERLIGGFADAVGGAVGATRAAVDTGMAPNDWQVGQTGKTVAPELYVGIGVSGAIQHMAGIQDSRIIVAINRDPEAPMVQIATYSLVGDLFEIVPKLISSIRR